MRERHDGPRFETRAERVERLQRDVPGVIRWAQQLAAELTRDGQAVTVGDVVTVLALIDRREPERVSDGAGGVV